MSKSKGKREPLQRDCFYMTPVTVRKSVDIVALLPLYFRVQLFKDKEVQIVT